MKVHSVPIRDHFGAFLEEQAGYHSWNGYDYIDPGHVAEITRAQADFLAQAGKEMYRLCIAAVDKVVATGRFAEFGIGHLQAQHITASWKRAGGRDPELYGRIDFWWDGGAKAKFYEINADTPTTSYECAVVQWVVVNDLMKRGELPEGLSQFNSLEEKIIARMAHLRTVAAKRGITRLHFSSMTDWREDLTTTSYLDELAQKAGWDTKFIDIGLIGADETPHSPDIGTFYDTDREKIVALYKLMPWEHMYETKWAKYVALDRVMYVEPPWKAIMSNKMLSVILWEMFPDHPLLLPAFTKPDSFKGTYVEKPIFGRISAGVKIFQNNLMTGSRRFDPDEPAAGYSKYPKIYQEFCPLPEMPGMPGWRYATGVWVVGDGEVAGMDLRIDKSLVTGGGAIKFLPHVMGD